MSSKRLSLASFALFAVASSLGCQAFTGGLPGLGSAPATHASEATGTLTLRLRVPPEALPGYTTTTLPGGTATLTLTLANPARIGPNRVANVTLVGGQTLYTVTLPTLPVGDGYTLEAEAKNGSGVRLAYSNRLESAATDPVLNQPTADNPYALPPLAFTVKSGANNVGIGLRILPVAGNSLADSPGTATGSVLVNAGYLRTLTVTSTKAVNAGYTVSLPLNSAALVTASKLRADMNDLRVLYWDGSRYVEITRQVDSPNTATSAVRFRLQKAIAASGSDANYRLTYGYNYASTAPSDPAQIYDYYESFEYSSADLPDQGWNSIFGSGTAAISGARVRTGTGGLHLDSNVGDYRKDLARFYTFPTDFALRSYMYDANTDTTYHNWIGPQMGELGGGTVIGMTSASSTTKYAYNVPPSVWAAGTVNRSVGWHAVEIRRYNGNVDFLIDDTLVATASDTRAFTALYLRCGNSTDSVSCVADWDDITVRPYVSPEPAVALGAEGSL